MTMRIELVAGGALSNKKVKRRMNNSLNFYLVLPRLTPPVIRGRQAGPCLTKKVKRKMSKALNLTSFYRCLTPYCGVARRRPPPVQRTSTEPRR